MAKNNYARLKQEADIETVVNYLGIPVRRKGTSCFLLCPLPQHADRHATNCYFKPGWNNLYCNKYNERNRDMMKQIPWNMGKLPIFCGNWRDGPTGITLPGWRRKKKYFIYPRKKLTCLEFILLGIFSLHFYIQMQSQITGVMLL